MPLSSQTPLPFFSTLQSLLALPAPRSLRCLPRRHREPPPPRRMRRLRARLPPRLPVCGKSQIYRWVEQAVAVGGEISQIYRSEGPASARKDPSSIPNVSEAIASLSSTLEANSPREKHRCSFAPRLRRGQSSEPSLLTLEEVTPCR
ncbi:hypothetical protein LR48_Vigan07g159300 [Vigna angularis]|uniref:Uncharacterized protein n=1 Tax=Phaseolus angularis TaxID=3914 RepID=A0A0L9UZB7_PHAAN|nr:hypothetical protein LR48_Vigan07g159300 [Vigna angularis]